MEVNDNLEEFSNINHHHVLNDDTKLELSQSFLSEYSGVGKAQNATNFGQASFINNDVNVSNNENATIIIPNEWQGNQINWSLTEIYEYDNLWTNETFDTPIDTALWSNGTNSEQHKDYVESQWYQNPSANNDSITLAVKHHLSDDWKGVSANLTYSRYLDSEQIPYGFWDLYFQYKFIDYSDWTLVAERSRFICIFKLNGIEIQIINPKINQIDNKTLENVEFSFFPEFYNLDPPGTLEVTFILDFDDVINPNNNLTLFIDNFTLTLQTMTKPSQINLNIIDYEHSISTPISNIDYGSGEVTLVNNWNGDIGGKEFSFGFESNSTGTLIIFSECGVSATSQYYTRRHITSLIGSEFTIENNTKCTWTMYVPIIIPGAYTTNFYLNLTRPINWNVTQVIDPYFHNRINDTIGAGFGNSTLTIPEDIILGGTWIIIAESPNYVEEGTIFRYSNSEWQKNVTFHIGDTLKINGTAKTFPNIQNTNISLKIYYPNETLWYQEVDIPVNSDRTYEFADKVVNEMSAVSGEYSAQIIWHDRNENMTQVGYSILKFEVIHRTSLTAVKDNFELYKGDPLLIKVNFTDLDFNEGIPSAFVNYNSTYNASGIMTYEGGGIYLADLDTSSLELGNYYFSFNATDEYFDDIYMKDLILLKIIAQPLELEVPHEILTAIANSYFTCQINVTGGITGALIWPANVSTNWINPYSVSDHGNGTFTLNFSTYNLPTKGVSEIYTILISANKTFYGATSHTMTLTINPIPTIANANSSLIYVPINEVAEIEISYNQEGSEVLIDEANCSVVWPGSYNIFPQVHGFIVCLNTSTLSINTYTAIVKLEKAGYETAYKSLTIIVEQRSIYVTTIGFHDSIEGYAGESISITLNLFDERSRIPIQNASLFYSWDFGTGFFTYLENGTYELILKLPENIKGSHKMSITISQEGVLYKTQDFSFIIVITERSLPNYLFWVLFFGILILVGVLTVIGLRSYVILPRKREKESKLLARTQRYKDIMNIEALVVSQRASGLYLYLKSYYSLEKYREELLSGFIQAITILSQEIVRKEDLQHVYTVEGQPKSIESLIELDFKHFYFLIGDYKELRIIFILKEKASNRFKSQLENLLLALDLQFSEQLENWNGQLEKFDKILPSVIYEYFDLFYKGYFQLNNPKHIAMVRKEIELSTMELRVLNTIYSIIKGKENFYLYDVIEMVEEKNKDLIIDAVESLLEKKVIISTI